MRMPTRVGLGGLAAVAVTFGFARYGYGLFMPVLRAEFGLSTQVLGVVASASYTAYLVTMLGAGVVAARLGPRAPVVIGSLSAAVGMTVVAVAPKTSLLVLGIVLAGSSAGWSYAPFADAVTRMVESGARPRVLSVISTGTAFGLMAAAPIALLAGASWRPAWAAFAAIAFATASYNAWLLPEGHTTRNAALPRLRPGWFICPRSGPLLAFGFVYTLAGSVYLTYAVDLVHNRTLATSGGPALWLAIGIAGIGGVATGDLVARYGLTRTHGATMLGLAASIAALGAAPLTFLTLLVSAVLFGASYMTGGALLSVWSSRAFADRPSTGLTAVILAGSLGAITGPAAAGALATHVGMSATFLAVGATTALAVIVRPAAVDRLAPSSAPSTTASRGARRRL